MSLYRVKNRTALTRGYTEPRILESYPFFTGARAEERLKCMDSYAPSRLDNAGLDRHYRDMSETQTTFRNTPAGIVAIRGNRELHLLGTSVAATTKSRQLLAGYSFDRLFRAGRTAGAAGPKVRYIKVGA